MPECNETILQSTTYSTTEHMHPLEQRHPLHSFLHSDAGLVVKSSPSTMHLQLRSCLSTTNAIARRATTATARRPVLMSTVSLTSLAAGCACVDSKSKNHRMKQWDKAIGEARATVEATETQLQNRLAALSDACRDVDDEYKTPPSAPNKTVGKGKRRIREASAALKVRVTEQQNRLVALSDIRGGTFDDRMDSVITPDRVVEDVESWDSQKGEESVHLASWLNKVEEAFDTQKSEDLDHQEHWLINLEEALDSPEIKELVHRACFHGKRKDMPDEVTEDVKSWDTQKSENPFPNLEKESLETRESEYQVHGVPLNTDEPDTWHDVFEWAREEQNMREASGFQGWKGPPLSLLQRSSEIQLYELSRPRLLRHFYGGSDCVALVDEPSRRPFWTKKIRILEWSVAKLVLKLLMYTFKYYSRPWDDPDCPTTPLLRRLLREETMQGKLDYIEERLRILHADHRHKSYYEHFERPPFPNYDGTIVQNDIQITELNTSLQALLGLMEQRNDPGDILSKIIYHLLTTPLPPNIDTYNMLLLRFSLLRMNKQFKAVLISSRESMLRPNETTHVAALQHFTASSDLYSFFYYLKRMEGLRGGLALGFSNFHPILKERYHLFGRYEQKAAEKARMNGQVYESLIVGSIKYLSDQTAMRYYRSMVREGWSPSFGILLAILQDCCRRLDWKGGYTVLEQLTGTAEKLDTSTYEWMLRLCQHCGQDEIFDQILVNGVHCGVLPVSMLYLDAHDKAEDIGFLIERAQDLQARQAIGKSQETAARSSHLLDDESPFLLENILYGCEDPPISARVKHFMMMTRDLKERLDDVTTDIKHTFLQASRVLYASRNTSCLEF